MKQIFGLASALAAVVTSSGCVIWNGDFPAKVSRAESSVYSVARGGRVELTTPNGIIRIGRSAGGEVRIDRTTTCRAKTDEEAAAGVDQAIPEVLSGPDFLTVKVHGLDSSRRQVTVDLEAAVPAETSLVLRTSNGEVQVRGIEGDLDISSGNGKLTARDGGRRKVKLETGNGEVVGENLAGSITARTGNGAVKLSGCTGKIDVRSSNGALVIESPDRAAEGITAQTSNGSIRCVLPGSFSGDLQAETSLGGVRCDFPTGGGTSSHHSLRATIGAGGPQVHLKSECGSIEVLRGSP